MAEDPYNEFPGSPCGQAYFDAAEKAGPYNAFPGSPDGQTGANPATFALNLTDL